MNIMNKIKDILSKNKFVTFLCILAVIVIIISYKDSKIDKSAIIKVNIEKTGEEIKNVTEEINYYVYNPGTNAIEQKTSGIESKRSIIEGDYINEIIANSPFLPEKLKFLSAYKLNAGQKELIIFSNDLMSLKETNINVYNNFVESVRKTISEKFNVREVEIQIEGETEL